MPRDNIPVKLRRLVAKRAVFSCEYCLMPENRTAVGCEIDHIIGLKHGGPTEEANLALACYWCNRNKGSDIGSIDWTTKQIFRFFNPRTDIWAEHFQLIQSRIEPVSQIGLVTVQIFRFNDTDRVYERRFFDPTQW
jgi:HNH endonuclease